MRILNPRLDPYAEEIDAWLTAEPHLMGAEVLKRLGERARTTVATSSSEPCSD